MQNPTSACAVSGNERSAIAEQLYLAGGAGDADRRCDLNTQFGQLDLGAELVRRTGLLPGQTIADIGCGSGQHLEIYARVVGPSGLSLGFDFSVAAIRAACSKGLTAVVASGEAIPLRDASLDALTCNYAIYYMPDLQRLLREWARLLRPHGRMVITGPAADSNAELYRFHLEAASKQPSDADRIALGFVDQIVASRLSTAALRLEDVTVLSNPVTFPPGRFLEYWRATSLFLRTVPPASVDDVMARGSDLLQRLPHGFTVTKRVAVVTARRPGG